MKIVIDAYQAAPVITGSDRLAHNLLRELQQLDSTNEFTIITNAKYDFIATSIASKNFRVFPIHAKKRLIWLNFRLPYLLLRYKADVFFSFHNFAGPGIKVCRTVGSILDSIPFTHPDLYFGQSLAVKRWAVKFSMRQAAKNADRFVAISSFTKSSSVAALGLDPNKIKVMPLQADPIFFEATTAAELEKVAQKYRLPPGFVFALGASEPRKNVARLIQAHQALPENLRARFPLMVGGAKWHNQGINLKGDGQVRLLGFIADEDLPLVFRLATVFAFPSIYEGFGLTVLEAMASGTAVIASNTTSIPEAAGEAAILFDPNSVEEITAALKKMLTDPLVREKFIKAGRLQVNQFSWKQAATQLHQILVDQT